MAQIHIAEVALRLLQKMGYKRVVSVDGGWRGWNAAGFPVEKEGG